MDQPLGRAVGNALEIREAVDTLRGEGPEDLVRARAGRGPATCSRSPTSASTTTRAAGAPRRRSRAAPRIEVYERWIRAQGGDPSLEALPQAPVVRAVPAPAAGFVEGIATTAIGIGSLHLGAGRATKDDAIDHAVGVDLLAKRGDRVEAGAPLAGVHARRTRRRAGRRGTSPPATGSAGDAPEPVPIVLEVSARRLARPRRGGSVGHARAARGRDDPSALEPMLAGRRFDRVEISDGRLTRPEPPGGRQPSS